MNKNISLLTLILLFALNSQSQSLKKYPIGNSGCSVYMFCDPGKFSLSYSEDSAKVYTGQCIADKFIYGIICVNLKDTMADMDDAESLLESYLDFLKPQFKIRDAAGYGKGGRLNSNENTSGIVDYWDGEDKSKWAIQGWTDGKFIAVLYVKGSEQPDYTKQKLFFNGFVFPGMK